MTATIPAHLAHLPTHRGMPVPHVAAWSSEGETVIRHDPVVDQLAVFARGRQGRGRPVFGAISPERQRRSVMLGRCQVCDRPLDEAAYLLDHPRLVEASYRRAGDPADAARPLIGEPPACRPCADWASTGCPGIAGKVASLIEVDSYAPLAQLVDPGAEPLAKASRFDRADDDAARARLSAIVRRLAPGGVVGYVRFEVTAGRNIPLPTDP